MDDFTRINRVRARLEYLDALAHAHWLEIAEPKSDGRTWRLRQNIAPGMLKPPTREETKKEFFMQSPPPPPEKPPEKPGCLNPAHKGKPSHSHGLCINCYQIACRLIKTGKTSWKQLEAAGKARPGEKSVSEWLLEDEANG